MGDADVLVFLVCTTFTVAYFIGLAVGSRPCGEQSHRDAVYERDMLREAAEDLSALMDDAEINSGMGEDAERVFVSYEFDAIRAALDACKTPPGCE